MNTQQSIKKESGLFATDHNQRTAGRCLTMTELGWCGGFVIRTRENQLVFDPSSTGNLRQDSSIFISHAHADHSTGLRSKFLKYSSQETRKIFENLSGRSVVNFHDTNLGRSIKLGDVEVTPINAGHMLGSTQFLVTLPDTTILYTGDINYIDTLTTKRAEKVQCDILVTEATYGDPLYVFPDREEIYANIVKWTLDQINKGLVPTFQVYAAGKAQELVRLFNLYTNLDVTTNQKIAKVNAIYSNSGLNLNCNEVNSEVDSKSCVCITTRSNPMNTRNYARAVTTGWALKMHSSRAGAFPLSSHADFSQLLQFVKDSGAKMVYGFTGYTDIFATEIRRNLGISSRPLPHFAQKTLQCFS